MRAFLKKKILLKFLAVKMKQIVNNFIRLLKLTVIYWDCGKYILISNCFKFFLSL